MYFISGCKGTCFVLQGNVIYVTEMLQTSLSTFHFRVLRFSGIRRKYIAPVLSPFADGLISSGYAGGRPQSRLCACPRAGWKACPTVPVSKSGSRIGVTASMRRYRLRRIQSGEPRKSFGFPPLPKYHTRACSRNVSTIRVTRMLRLYFRPGI